MNPTIDPNSSFAHLHARVDDPNAGAPSASGRSSRAMTGTQLAGARSRSASPARPSTTRGILPPIQARLLNEFPEELGGMVLDYLERADLAIVRRLNRGSYFSAQKAFTVKNDAAMCDPDIAVKPDDVDLIGPVHDGDEMIELAARVNHRLWRLARVPNRPMAGKTCLEPIPGESTQCTTHASILVEIIRCLEWKLAEIRQIAGSPSPS